MRAPTARPPRRRTPHPCPAWYALLASAAWPAAPALAEPSDAAARWAALEGEPGGDPGHLIDLPPLGAFAPGDPRLDRARFRADPLRPLTVSAALDRWRCAAEEAAAAGAVADLERLCRGESALACEVLVALEAAVPAPGRGPCGVAWVGAEACRPEAALAAVWAHLTPSALGDLCAEGETATCGLVWRDGRDAEVAGLKVGGAEVGGPEVAGAEVGGSETGRPEAVRCAAVGQGGGGREGRRRRGQAEHFHPHRLERLRGPGPRATPQRARGAQVSPGKVGGGRGGSR